MVAPGRTIEELAAIVERAGVKLKRVGREHVGCCPFHAENTGSFTLFEKTRGRARYHCFGCGADGDVVGFLKEFYGYSYPEALRLLEGETAFPTRKAKPTPAPQKQRRAPISGYRGPNAPPVSERLWEYAKPYALGRVGAVDRYFATRGLVLAGLAFGDRTGREYVGLPPSIRVADSLGYHARREDGGIVEIGRFPAIVAGVQAIEGRIVAVHVTWLAPDGGGKAELVHPETGEILPSRKIYGPYFGGALRLGPPRSTIAIAEGLETGLSVHALLQLNEESARVSVWCALSLNNIAGGGIGSGRRRARQTDGSRVQRLPSEKPDPAKPGIVLPPQARDVWDFLDADNKDPDAAKALIARAHARWTAEGRRVRAVTPPPGMDFNDLICKGDAHGFGNFAA